MKWNWTRGRSRWLPITMALVDKRRKSVKVDAITAAQFIDVPKLERPDQITFDEEERVVRLLRGPVSSTQRPPAWSP